MSILVLGKTPTTDYRWVLRPGQHARVGRSPWAEFCLEGDDELQEYHCQLTIAHDERPLVAPIEAATLAIESDWTPIVGNREQLRITAGRSQLCLQRLRQPDRNDKSTPIVAERAPQHAQVVLRPEASQLRELGLSEAAIQLIESSLSAENALSQLIEHAWLDDGLRYLAACLPAPARLNWCHEMLQQAGQVLPDDARGLVQLWLAEPQEAIRQAIAQRVDWNRKQDPTTWLLASFGWTGGSLSSHNSIPVAPTDQMISTGVITALNLTAARTDMASFQLAAIERGLQSLTSAFPLREKRQA